VNVEVLVRCHVWSKALVFLLVFSTLCYPPIMFLYSEVIYFMGTKSMQGVGVHALLSGASIHALVVGTGIYLLCSLFITYISRLRWPTPVDRLNDALRHKGSELSAWQFASRATHIRRDVIKVKDVVKSEEVPDNSLLAKITDALFSGLPMRNTNLPIKLNLNFKSDATEEGYRQYLLQRSFRAIRLCLFILAAGLFLFAVYEFVGDEEGVSLLESQGVSYLGMGVVALLVLVFIHTKFFRTRWDRKWSLLQLAAIAGAHAFFTGARMDSTSAVSILTTVIFIISQIPFSIAFQLAILQTVIYTMRYFFTPIKNLGEEDQASYDKETQVSLFFNYIPWLLAITIFQALSSYRSQYYDRYQYNMQQKLQIAMLRTKAVLCNMLPKQVVDGILAQGGSSGQNIFASDCGTITIIFCDIYNFAPIVGYLEPFSLVKMLDSVFTTLDRLASRFGIYKIETVGSEYLGVGGLKNGAGGSKNASPSQSKVENVDVDITAAAVVEFAIHILRKMATMPLDVPGRPNHVEVKIGINSGTAISGIVGAKKPQFVVVGDTVNTAARMKGTNPHPDKIHISPSTYDLIKDFTAFEWDPRQTKVKGKGEMTTYLLKDYKESEIDIKRAMTQRAAEMSDVAGNARASMFNHQPNSPGRSPGKMSGVENGMGLSTMVSNKLKRFNFFADDSQMVAEHAAAQMDSDLMDDGGESGQQNMPTAYKWRRHPLTLRFEDHVMEQQFRHTYQSDDTSMYGVKALIRIVVIFWIGFYVVVSAETLINKRTPQQKLVNAIAYRASFLFLAICLLFLFRRVKTKVAIYSMATFVTVGAWTAALSSFFMQEDAGDLDFTYRTVIEIFLWMTMIACSFGLLFVDVLVICLLVYGAAMAVFGYNFQRASQVEDVNVASAYVGLQTDCMVFLTLYTALTIVGSYMVEKHARMMHAEVQNYDHIRSESNRFLSDMMPVDIYRRLREERLHMAYRYDRMTFLFADICGFTAFSAAHTATEVVTMLTHLFSVFDKLTTELEIYKVCTIGDAYVCCTEPVPESSDQPKVRAAMRIMEMSNLMMQHIRNTAKHLQISELDMRIGLHHGEFVGGIIGQKTLRYDIWGIDVMKGTACESGGIPGQVSCSLQFKQFVEQNCPKAYTFQQHKDVEVVGQKVELFLLSNIEQEVPVKIEEYTERLFKQQSSGEKLPKLKGGGFKTKVFGVRESGGPVG
jgi:class 3 adenylate cyclase